METYSFQGKQKIPNIDQINNLTKSVFELTSFNNFLPFINQEKLFSREKIDLLIYTNHYCLITNLDNFWNEIKCVPFYVEDS